MDVWNTNFLLRWPIFRCQVSFRECNFSILGASTRITSWTPLLLTLLGGERTGAETTPPILATPRLVRDLFFGHPQSIKEDSTLRFLLSWHILIETNTWKLKHLYIYIYTYSYIYNNNTSKKTVMLNEPQGFPPNLIPFDYLYFYFDSSGAASGETRSPNSLGYNLVPRSTEHLQPCFTFGFSFCTHVLRERSDINFRYGCWVRATIFCCIEEGTLDMICKYINRHKYI